MRGGQHHGRFLRATIDSVLDQDYPALFYHVQDGGSGDDTIDILNSYRDKISWRSAPDQGQSDAINAGFAGVDCDVMGYLNSDDTLLPGALACVANFFPIRKDQTFLFLAYEGLRSDAQDSVPLLTHSSIFTPTAEQGPILAALATEPSHPVVPCINPPGQPTVSLPSGFFPILTAERIPASAW